MSKSGIQIAICLFISFFSGLILTSNCRSAGYYKYADKNGTVCFTDKPQSIPKEYRKSVSKVGDQTEIKDYDAKGDQGKGENEDGLKGKERKFYERMKSLIASNSSDEFLRPVVSIIVFIGLFFVIGKIGSSIGHKQLSSVLRFALTIGALVYLFHTHIENMANSFNLLKKNATDIVRQSEERNKKIEETGKDQSAHGGHAN